MLVTYPDSPYRLFKPFEPAGDQPEAIAKLVEGLDDGLAFPNGIVLAPDGKKLYLAESQKNRVLLYEVAAPGKVGEPKVFAELPRKNMDAGQIDNQPDGMCLDAAGNLYVGVGSGLQVVSPDGGELTLIPIPSSQGTTSCTFGGDDARRSM